MTAGHDEIVLFTEKPNAFLYALEFTRHALLAGTAVGLFINIPFMWPGLYSARGVVLLLITYALLGLPLFIVAFVTARQLMFVVTDKRAIVRSSFWRTKTDGLSIAIDELSIAIETVKRIEITSYGATYGSVYLSYDKTSPRENFKDS
jgi:hypothetical protein